MSDIDRKTLRDRLPPVDNGPRAHPSLPRRKIEYLSHDENRLLRAFDYWRWQLSDPPTSPAMQELLEIPKNWPPPNASDDDIVGVALVMAFEQCTLVFDGSEKNWGRTVELSKIALREAGDPVLATAAAIRYARESGKLPPKAINGLIIAGFSFARPKK